jgi:nucleoside-diphosphate-sugar epimerase
MTRYLITGAQGFAGRYLVADLLAHEPDAQIVGVGRSRPRPAFTHDVTWRSEKLRAPLAIGLDSPPADRFRYVECDLTDAPAVTALLERETPDVVIHLAAALRDDPAPRLLGSNVLATMTVFGALAKCEPKPHVIYGSSGAVYGPIDAVPVRETARCAPADPYSKSKHAGEYVARIIADENGLPVLFARIFNIAGPGQDERHVCARFAAQVAAMDGSGPHVLRVGDLRPTRDFVDVRDVAQALRVLAHAGAPGEIYNVASGRETTIEAVLRETLRIAGLGESVEIVADYVRNTDVSRQYADISKLRALGYEPAFALEATLRDLLEYYTLTVAAAASV